METEGGVKGSVTQNPGSLGSILNSTRGERAGKPSALGTGAENQGPSYCYTNAILCYSSAFGGKDFLPQGLPCPSKRAALHSKTLRKIRRLCTRKHRQFLRSFCSFIPRSTPPCAGRPRTVARRPSRGADRACTAKGATANRLPLPVRFRPRPAPDPRHCRHLAKPCPSLQPGATNSASSHQ